MYKALLVPHGQFIISIPNAVVWGIRLKFFFGIFNYSDTGTCDRTHIRFFTLASMRRLLKIADLKIIKEDCTPSLCRPLIPLFKKIMKTNSDKDTTHNTRVLLDSRLYKIYLKFIYPVEKFFCSINKRLFGLQLIFVTEL